MRCGFPAASVAVASDIFLAGSKAANLISFGASETVLLAAAVRIGPSTGSGPPSELASAANARTWASSNPGKGQTVVTVSAFLVSVPVLSAQRTTIDAASSTAERRVGRTPNFARARAPRADASEIAHHAQDRLLLRAHDMRGAHELGGATEFGPYAGCRNLRLAAPNQRPRVGLKTGGRLR